MRSNFYSHQYQDIYFNPDDPESEKQYVFIEANRIAERMASAALPDGDPKTGRSHQDSGFFTVAELGFGFGLNCALTLHAAKKADCWHKLRYFSVEENFPPENEVKALAEKLKICGEEYGGIWTPPPNPLPTNVERGRTFFPFEIDGFQKPLSTSWGGVAVGRGGVHHGSAIDFLTSANFLADCWYFDGFSPAKNPEMWSAEVFARAFVLTRPGGTFSTYTSAGWVRRNLEAAGFVVNKVPGFGNKREMLVGYKEPVVPPSTTLGVDS